MPLATEPEPSVDRPWQPTHIRVPREDGSWLAIPELSQACNQVSVNATALAATETVILGRPLSALRSESRNEVVEAASLFTAGLTGEQIDVDPGAGLVVTGHQPELFHCGVWVKNLAVSEFARQSESTALNLVVDNDLRGSTRIRIPGGSPERPRLESIDFDAVQPAIPWEEASIQDKALFESFGKRVVERLALWNVRPVLAGSWGDAVAHSATTNNAGECLTAMRTRLERRYGFGTLELPISRLSKLSVFSQFAAHILFDIEQFRAVYNQTLAEYREVNHIRSRTHPVPELQQHGDWIEAPFWLWRQGEIERRRVLVRRAGDTVQVSARTSETALDFEFDPHEQDPCTVLQQLDPGMRFRPRALTTTLFARLFLADLFVHGIGGAKYDEITDRILSRFYGVHPPAFLTLSATARLPIAEPYPETDADLRRVRALLRELQHNPQRFVDRGTNAARRLIDEKETLISEQHAADARRRSGAKSNTRSRDGIIRYRRLPEINRELSAFTVDTRLDLQNDEFQIRDRLKANAVFNSREFPFCLYPEERIRRLVGELSQQFD